MTNGHWYHRTVWKLLGRVLYLTENYTSQQLTPKLIHHHHHHWHYSPWRALASFKVFRHSTLFVDFCFQLVIPQVLRSSSTWSIHLILGLPLGLDPLGFSFRSLRVVLLDSILSTCPSHWALLFLITVTISDSLYISYISRFVLILHYHIPPQKLFSVSFFPMLSTILHHSFSKSMFLSHIKQLV